MAEIEARRRCILGRIEPFGRDARREQRDRDDGARGARRQSARAARRDRPRGTVRLVEQPAHAQGEARSRAAIPGTGQTRRGRTIHPAISVRQLGERDTLAGLQHRPVVGQVLGIVLQADARQAVERLEEEPDRDRAVEDQPGAVAPYGMRELVREQRLELLALQRASCFRR